MNRKALVWIERYSAAVGRMLPASGRKDIEMEIQSLLLDELEGQESGDGATESDALALLQRYPSPTEMATRYGATQALIGPVLYPTYVTVVRLVGLIVAVVAITMLLLGLFTEGTGVSSIIGALWSVFTSVFSAVAMVTLIFALVERSYSSSELKRDFQREGGWDPSALPPVEGVEHVSVSDMIGEIVGTVVAILWLNLYVNADGSLMIFADGATQFDVFSALFLAFIPWLTVLWVGDLIVQVVVLARRRWERATRRAAILLGAGECFLLGWMLTIGPLAATSGLERWVRGGVAAVLVVTLLQLLGHLWRLYRSRGERASLAAPSTAL